MPARQRDIWAAVSDIQNARRWNTAWTRIEITTEQTHGAGARFRAHTEGGEAYDFEVTGWTAPEYIAFSPIRDEHERYGITLDSHAFLLKAIGEEETVVELIARATGRGLRGRFTALFFWPGYQKEGLNLALDSLEALLTPRQEGNPKSEPEAPSPVD
jgi:hypothetical protein